MGPEARRSRSAQRPRHPTAQLLLNHVAVLLETTPMDAIHIATVLERSGVSHGSLYHHFEDFPDLVEQAVVLRFEQGLQESIQAVRGLLDCVDAADFREQAERLLLMLNEQGRRKYRLYRVEVFGAMQSRPRLAERVSEAQQRLIDAQGDCYVEFQRRGWFRDDVDPYALSTFTTAIFLGRAVDDVGRNPVDPELWNHVAMIAFRAVLFGD